MGAGKSKAKQQETPAPTLDAPAANGASADSAALARSQGEAARPEARVAPAAGLTCA